MCIAFIANQCHSKFPLVIGLNRDEFHDRPAEPLERRLGFVAGLDVRSQGGWLRIEESGFMALLTSYRDRKLHRSGLRSRGDIVGRVCELKARSNDCFAMLSESRATYNPFNVVYGEVGPKPDLRYYSSQTDQVQGIPPGLHCLSNAYLDTPWPKTKRLRALVEELLNQPSFDPLSLFAALADDVRFPEDTLPETGLPRNQEVLISSIFVKSASYGTRSSTIVACDLLGSARITERSFAIDGKVVDERSIELAFAETK